MLRCARECFKKPTSERPKKEIPAKVQEKGSNSIDKPNENQKDEHRDIGKYYEPEVVSIGPYHSQVTKLQQMDKLKTKMAGLFCLLFHKKQKGRRFFRCCLLDLFLSGLKKVDKGKQIQLVLEFFKDVFEKMISSERIMDWYEKDLTEEINQEDFIRMMFLDGCFIIMFILCFLNFGLENLEMRKDIVTSVQKDIFLLNNQVPFKVLETLWNAVFEINDLHQMLNGYFRYCTIGYNRHFPRQAGHKNEDKDGPIDKHLLDIHHCCTKVYNRLFPKQTGDEDKDGQLKDKDEQSLHLLDLLRITWLGNAKHIKSGDVQPHFHPFWDTTVHERSTEGGHLFMKGRMFRNIMELRASGIYLRPNSSNLLGDMHFKSFPIGMLTLPRIIIDDSTKTIFLNMIELEKRLDNNYGITSYISFLDSLIDNADDVKLMRSAGVLQHFLDEDKDVADLFNEIGANLLPKVDIYEPVKEKIYHFFESQCRTMMATWLAEVHQVHLRTPWTTIALLAGTVAIVMTVMQTYFAIPRPKH